VRDYIFLQNLCFTIGKTGEREREREREREPASCCQTRYWPMESRLCLFHGAGRKWRDPSGRWRLPVVPSSRLPRGKHPLLNTFTVHGAASRKQREAFHPEHTTGTSDLGELCFNEAAAVNLLFGLFSHIRKRLDGAEQARHRAARSDSHLGLRRDA